MNHLSVDDIIKFVSMTELNDEALALSACVTAHIRECDECLELVRSFQLIYDEFTRLKSEKTFKKYLIEDANLEKLSNEISNDLQR